MGVFINRKEEYINIVKYITLLLKFCRKYIRYIIVNQENFDNKNEGNIFVKAIITQNENHSSVKAIKDKIAMYDQFTLFFKCCT